MIDALHSHVIGSAFLRARLVPAVLAALSTLATADSVQAYASGSSATKDCHERITLAALDASAVFTLYSQLYCSVCITLRCFGRDQ